MTTFGLVNLVADNEVDFFRNQGQTAFNSGGKGTNHVKSFDAAPGSFTSFGLQNLQSDFTKNYCNGQGL